MKISVITVCYNAASRIERTLKSVLSQDYSDFEYLVIDGASNDGTVDIINNYASRLGRFVSEPDSGIYNAMNKGVNLASGDFCIFMNAGDLFFDSSVLSKISAYLDDTVSIVMGNQYYVKEDGMFSAYRKHWESVTVDRLFYDSLFHQASFIRRSDLIDFPYDENLKMVSDWKSAIELLIFQNKQYRGVDVDVDVFFEDGITTTMAELRKIENRIVLKQMFSDSFIEQCFARRGRYKHLFNIKRYTDHLSKLFVDLKGRLRYSTRTKQLPL